MYDCQITIFTPTYNRGGNLKKLYGSLVSQSDRRFVWLIVDDGSVDNTAELIDGWKSEGIIAIEYIYQRNQGKHVAHNTGVLNANTAYFYCVDSDDLLPSYAVETIYDMIADTSERVDIAGIAAKKGYLDGNDMCTQMPGTISEASIRDIYKIYGLKGELALVFRTSVLREFLFPVFRGEKFVTENVVLDQISTRYKMRLLNKVIYLGEYLPDGYTSNLSRIHRENPQGYHHYLVQDIELARTRFELKRAYANYITGCWIIGYRVRLNLLRIIANLPEAFLRYIKLMTKERMAKSRFFRIVLRQVFKSKFL